MAKKLLSLFEIFLAIGTVGVGVGASNMVFRVIESGAFKPAHWPAIGAIVLILYAGIRLPTLLTNQGQQVAPSDPSPDNSI